MPTSFTQIVSKLNDTTLEWDETFGYLQTINYFVDQDHPNIKSTFEGINDLISFTKNFVLSADENMSDEISSLVQETVQSDHLFNSFEKIRAQSATINEFFRPQKEDLEKITVQNADQVASAKGTFNIGNHAKEIAQAARQNFTNLLTLYNFLQSQSNFDITNTVKRISDNAEKISKYEQ